jgi:uncharacterized membrane protein YkoI
LKISQHNILAVACITLLLISVLAPAQANAGDKDARGPRYAQNDSTATGQNSDRQKRKGSSRSSATQDSAAANTPKDNKEDKRTPGNADTQKQTPAISRSEAAAIAERVTGGRVLSVREAGRYWQVKVLVDEQRVRFVSVDMRSGAVR